MPSIIQIKRSANVAAPTTSDLELGELAYSYDKSNDGIGAKLYIEAENNSGAQVIHTIGGKYYTDIVDAATDANTANRLVKRDGSGNFSAGIITANLYGNANTATRLATTRYINLSGNATGTAAFDGSGNADIVVSLSGVVTANSITTFNNKTYDVSIGSNNKFSIQGNEISSYTGSGASVVLSQSPTINVLNISDSQINLDGGSGIYYWGGQSGVAQTGDLKAGIYASDPSSNNSLFTFGTNGSNKMSVGVEGSLFVGTAMPSNNGGLSTAYSGWLVVQSGGKFGGDIDTLGGLNLTDPTSGKIQFSDGSIQRTAYTSNHLTTANVVEVTNLYFTNARARAAITSGNAILYDSATGNITLSTSGVTPTTYGGTSSVPVITVDTFGRITSASNTTISTSFNITGGSGSDTVNGGETLAFTGNTGITTAVGNNTVYITNTGVTSLTGTANEVEVSASSGAVTIGLPNDVTIGNNLTVTGDLIVNGTAVTMNTATVTVEDPLVRFGNANPADTLDIGFFGEYTSGGQKFAGLFRDASDSGKFKLFVDLTSDPTTNVINTANYTVATLVSNLTGGTVSGLTANINVSDGGTGRGTLTTNAILYGQGTSAVGMVTGTAGQILQLNASGVPVFAGLDGGSY